MPAENRSLQPSQPALTMEGSDSTSTQTGLNIDDIHAEELETSSSQRAEEAKDAPKALVRSESKAIAFIRILLGLVLLFIAFAAAISIGLIMRSHEVDSFRESFRGGANRLASTSVYQVSLRLGTVTILASEVTYALQTATEQLGVSHTNFSFPPGRFLALTKTIRFVVKATIAIYAPFLRDENERQQFETFVKSKRESEDIIKCHVCGHSNRTYSNPDDYTTLPGVGTFTCQEIETAGIDGVIEPQFCSLVSLTASQDCFCEDSTKQIDGLEKVQFPESIFRFDGDEKVDAPSGSAPYSPVWEIGSSGGRGAPYLYDFLSTPETAEATFQSFDGNVPVYSKTYYRNTTLYKRYGRTMMGEPTATVFGAVYGTDGVTVVGSVIAEFPWLQLLNSKEAFANIPMLLVIQNSCGQTLSFLPDFADDSMRYIGFGDLHDKRFDDMFVQTTFEEYEEVVRFNSEVPLNQSAIDYCRYRVIVYPTEEHRQEFVTTQPILYGIGTFLIIMISPLVFAIYDWLVRRRQEKVMASAERTNAIVTSMFPDAIRERLYDQAEKEARLGRITKVKMASFVEGKDNFGMVGDPIADVFPSATVMIFDIENFTVWSAERDPIAMFNLLETTYGEFDRIAKKLGVFKIEANMDAYVAVCGLPNANQDHAVIMARFASLCLHSFAKSTSRLEVHLGPSTGDLKARVGLNSGPVIAGVLRGEKSRFQLFGDTVNLAMQLESSGLPMRIQAAKATVDLITQAGHDDWAYERKDRPKLKGKTSLQTFWIKPTKTFRSLSSAGSSMRSVSSAGSDSAATPSSADVVQSKTSERRKLLRLVNWNAEVLYDLLKCVVATRKKQSPSGRNEAHLTARCKDGSIVVDELVTVLKMPAFDHSQTKRRKEADSVELPHGVREELLEFVTRIQETYRDVPFHNFEHASHVILSARKLMARIIEPDNVDYQTEDAEIKIHNATYGIASDPLIHFTVVFSALIHDADHTGLSNGDLISMNHPLSRIYLEKSIAEQNSVDMAWRILNEDNFRSVRRCIYSTKEELDRFRQLLVNAVIATDIADKSLKSLRENRWDSVFPSDGIQGDLSQEDSDRRATVIYEYIIQAADISHTMQHWDTYMKFNRRLFEERYVAWVNGQAPKEPSGGWYGGELWFFDNYIIPLAQKLNKCGVFGASYFEFLTYALENRREWQERGKEIVPEFLKSCQDKYGSVACEKPMSLPSSRSLLKPSVSGDENTLVV